MLKFGWLADEEEEYSLVKFRRHTIKNKRIRRRFSESVLVKVCIEKLPFLKVSAHIQAYLQKKQVGKQ